MKCNKITLYYDGLDFTGKTLEELEKEYEDLKAQSDKLTDWPEIK